MTFFRPSQLRHHPRRATAVFTSAIVALVFLTARADATLTFTAGGAWDTDARKQAAIDALTAATARFNAFGDFGNHDIYAYYNAGIPTAQSNYLGSIGYGGTYPNERVTMHEMSHYLGTGTTGQWGSHMVNGVWNGTLATALGKQFDGDQAVLNGDSQHYWPYGLNYDSEGSEINKQREVAMVYALRGDMGLGPTAPASPATSVTLTASDALGTSGFNYASTWADAHFAHPNADYATGNFLLRTPASGNSFTFAGKSLTIDNTNGINGGLLYKGTGAAGVLTFKGLALSGGYVRHAGGSGDVFRLAGNVTLSASPTIDAAQGAISISATIGGTGSLTKSGTYPLTLATGATYTGDTTINAGTLRLAAVTPVAGYTFDSVRDTTVVNAGTGGPAMNGTLANGAAVVFGGHTGNAVSLANGASVDIANPISDLGPSGNWTVSAWVKTATAGATVFTKGDGSGWASGNTVFYLSDGTAGGSGGIPSAVRWGGGFLQGSAAATPVNNNAWHQITYVDSAGSYALYVDGVAQPLSPGNAGFANADIGSIVRLGVSTDTIAGDGAVNFNGLLDDVQFYDQALSSTQAAALYQRGSASGLLPSTTNVNIAAGATLDVSGAVQRVASLHGPAGAAVTLGSGQLIVSPGGNSQFAGTISGNGGSLVKSGNGTLTLSGNNTYTGLTTVTGGTLTLTSAAFDPVLSAAGADITAGRLVFAYANTPTPLPTILARLSSGAITSSTADTTHTLGYYDDPTTSTVTLLYTLTGDANLDGVVNADDYALLDRGMATGGSYWWQGDFNRDSKVDEQDYLLLDSTYVKQQGNQPSPEFLAQRESQFGPAYVSSLLASVPEPSLAACGLAFLPLLRRSRHHA